MILKPVALVWVSSKADHEIRDLGAGSLFGSLFQEAHMRLWGESDELAGVSIRYIDEQISTGIGAPSFWGSSEGWCLRIISPRYGEPRGVHLLTPIPHWLAFGLLYMSTDQAPTGQRSMLVLENTHRSCREHRGGQVYGEWHQRPPSSSCTAFCQSTRGLQAGFSLS